ncbi:MAG: hypothetical protein F4Y57_14555 [Acidobacteria bacterium]|nr:hypothetical protein [Acidobacteriota bacterium]
MTGATAVVAFVALFLTAAAAQNYRAPRTHDNRPDLNGIWQAVGSAHFDIEGHAADFSPSLEMGALGAVPAGLGVVVGGELPYKQEALAQRQANRENQLLYDPAVRCYMPGIPRATYQPFPFQIVQTPEYILFAYEFASASRIVYMNRPDFEAPADAWMGHSRGRWDGETLVIDVTSQVPETWFDRSGNYHSNSIRVEERYTATSENHLQYEATITDPEIYERPWTIRMPLYRRIDENMQLLEFKCVEFVEELMYGHLRKGYEGDRTGLPPLWPNR